eukprot:2094326-Pyramimonas_sp.AAC.1
MAEEVLYTRGSVLRRPGRLCVACARSHVRQAPQLWGMVRSTCVMFRLLWAWHEGGVLPRPAPCPTGFFMSLPLVASAPCVGADNG